MATPVNASNAATRAKSRPKTPAVVVKQEKLPEPQIKREPSPLQLRATAPKGGGHDAPIYISSTDSEGSDEEVDAAMGDATRGDDEPPAKEQNENANEEDKESDELPEENEEEEDTVAVDEKEGSNANEKTCSPSPTGSNASSGSSSSSSSSDIPSASSILPHAPHPEKAEKVSASQPKPRAKTQSTTHETKRAIPPFLSQPVPKAARVKPLSQASKTPLPLPRGCRCRWRIPSL